MPTLYYMNLTIHVIASMVWLGGMFFLGLVGAPALRTIESAALRQRLFQVIGSRFRTVGWWSIGVLVTTGLVNVHYRGWLRGGNLLAPGGFWSTATGTALAFKLVLACLMIALSAAHDFILGPRASRAQPGSAMAIKTRRRASRIARANAVLGLLLIAAAVRLARGG
jgi:uncharacterized membrane protein